MQPAHVLPNVALAGFSLHFVSLTVPETSQQQHDGQRGQYAVVDVRNLAAPTPVGVLTLHQPT